MIDNTVVRPYDPADTTALRELFAQSIEYLTADDYTDAQRLAWVMKAEDWEEFDERLKSCDTFVVEVDLDVAGFICFKNKNEIDMLFVHPHHARCGVGRRLLEAVELLARARGCKELKVDASDTALPFFEAHEFVASERHLVEFEDQILTNTSMVKPLVDKADKASTLLSGAAANGNTRYDH